jgi:hypothetical protein
MTRRQKFRGKSPEAIKESASRKLHDGLGFWKVCNEKRCRRVRACAGDVDACNARHWPHVPEEVKTWILAGLEACSAGASPDEAVRIADEKAAAYRGVSSS